MHLDVVDLRQFYYRTRLGRIAQKAVRDAMLSLWPNASGQTVVGFGFAVPLLRPYLDQSRRVIGLMPQGQGVMPWPAGMSNVAALCEDARWPLSEGMADRLVMLHGLETSDDPAALLDEAARALGAGGGPCSLCQIAEACGRAAMPRPLAMGGPTASASLRHNCATMALCQNVTVPHFLRRQAMRGSGSGLPI